MASSVEISLNVVKCLGAFYIIYYCVGSLAFGAYSLQHFDGKIPFDFNTWVDYMECCKGYTSSELVNLISLMLTYFVLPFVLVTFIRHALWDYILTVTTIHVAVSSLVMLEFPLNWNWWASLGIASLFCICIGESLLLSINAKSLYLT
ncbi:PREDICTED: transmembrane protein 244-like isoform X1 [Priapulus caudatus]|uniref:Transmembrane protein 244-like isoform X1 n=1 Tax=Priapulus caudatus TaxID=37621 RepID=A0ABM1E8Q7_PRICU|nr:PREDICTED: transmembrane protein 244-like isoform X1 [Priapulus caudatus]